MIKYIFLYSYNSSNLPTSSRPCISRLYQIVVKNGECTGTFEIVDEVIKKTVKTRIEMLSATW